MNFEVKKIEPIGQVTSLTGDTSSQWLNITVGVVDCPYADIKSIQTVAYIFSNSITVTEARAGIDTFATNWVATNYPNI